LSWSKLTIYFLRAHITHTPRVPPCATGNWQLLLPQVVATVAVSLSDWILIVALDFCISCCRCLPTPFATAVHYVQLDWLINLISVVATLIRHAYCRPLFPPLRLTLSKSFCQLLSECERGEKFLLKFFILFLLGFPNSLPFCLSSFLQHCT